MDFTKEFDNDKKATSGGEWFKFGEGANKIRILSTPVKFFEMFDNNIKKYRMCYHECGFTGSLKYFTWVLDYKDKDNDGKIKIKPAKIPFTAMEQIVGVMKNEDYAFNGFPAPYDLTINAVNAGTKDVVYTAVPARNNSEVAPEFLEELSKKKTVEEMIELLKNKQIEKDKEAGIYEDNAMRAERLAKQPRNTEPVDTIEYPNDDINPEDIPF